MNAKPKPVEMCQWTVKWNNPYTEPPNGQPRILGSVTLPRGEAWEPHLGELAGPPGNGYGIHFQLLNLNPRKLSEAAKQSIRRKALERRMRAKNPLFADAAIAAALAAQPDYYGVKND